MRKVTQARIFFERHVKSVRLFFIYASFTTVVGGFLVYLILAFWLKIKDTLHIKRSSVFDL